jgi:hypothetical protein
MPRPDGHYSIHFQFSYLRNPAKTKSVGINVIHKWDQSTKIQFYCIYPRLLWSWFVTLLYFLQSVPDSRIDSLSLLAPSSSPFPWNELRHVLPHQAFSPRPRGPPLSPIMLVSPLDVATCKSSIYVYRTIYNRTYSNELKRATSPTCERETEPRSERERNLNCWGRNPA